MPTVRVPDGRLVNFPDDMPQEEIRGIISSKFPEAYKEPERTALGQTWETAKAIPRGFGRTLLTAAEGVGELADAATNVVGLENLIDSGDDNALVSAARQGQKALNDSWLGVDDAYQDAWMTKFGEGLGSMATFLTPTGALRLAGVAGRATKSTAALASALGTGTATERVQRARDEGKEVSGGQEDTAALVGAIIGLSELAPVNRLLRHLDPNLLTPAQKATVMQKLSSAFTMGGVEALQEVSADLAQDLTEQKIYNPDVDFGAEALDSFTIGGAVGFTADLVLSAMAGRRAVTNKKTQETDELGKREGERQGAEIRKRQFESVDTLRGGRPVAEIDPATIEPQNEDMGSYARDIAGTLGRNFPTDTSFTVEQVDIPLTEQELALQPEQRDAEGEPLGVPLSTTKPAFQVYDSKRQAYGTPRVEHEQAAMLAGTLNRQIVDQTARNTVSETVETTPEQYDEATIATLEVIGNRVKNPRANEITADDLNMAAETTVDKGFDENLSAEQAMQRNMGRVFTEPDMVNSLTAAQRVNRKRLADGMPETSTFTVEEAKDVLGDQFGRLGDIGAGGILETQRYSVSQDRRGNPVVLSTAGEVITTDRIERRRKRDGKPYVQKRRIKTEDQAQRLAERLNTRYDRAVDEVVFEDIKAGNEEIKALLERKNIPNELDSPAIKTMAKAFVGKENVNDMDTGEKKFFYQKIRKLPVVPSPLVEGLPDFNQTATLTEDTTVTEEPLALPPPEQQLASDELVVEMQERLDAELKRKNLAGKGVTGKIFQQFRNYGLNKAGEPVFTGEVETAEGAYLKDFNQIAFGIQQAIAGKDVDMNDSDAVFAAIKDVLNHETVHALRALDLFTAEEYQVLETAAENTKRKGEKITYLADIEANPGYEDLSRTQKMEEAIAELVRQNTTLGGRPRSIINKIKDTLEAIARWITGSSPGVKRIVESIESGEIGGREAGEVRTLRATREELDLYEYEDIEGTPSGRRMIGDTSEELEAELGEGLAEVEEVEEITELDDQPIARSTITNEAFLQPFVARNAVILGEPSYHPDRTLEHENHFQHQIKLRKISLEQVDKALRYGKMYKAYPKRWHTQEDKKRPALIFKGEEVTVVAQLRGTQLVLKTAYYTDKPPMREGTQQRASDDHWEGDSAIAYSRRRNPPEQTQKAYKLFRTKADAPGKLFPLFVDANTPVPIGEWVQAKSGPQDAKGKVKSKLGALAYRPGWHSGDAPIANHIGQRNPNAPSGKPAFRPPNQVWAEVEVGADVDWQTRADKKAKKSKAGNIIPRTAQITDRVPKGGFYRYKTNPNMEGNWIISGDVKVNRVLSDQEVSQINEEAGVSDLPRMQPRADESIAYSRRRAVNKEGKPLGINVAVDKDGTDYADLIVNGSKAYESRESTSLNPYIGKRVGIVRTGAGPAEVIGSVEIGEPIEVGVAEFNELRSEHLVPEGSVFDIKADETKYLYPMIDPSPSDPQRVTASGIVSRVIPTPDDESIAYSRRRVGTTGQYVGAPRALDSPQKLASLRKSIRKLAEEGEYGKFWYERSGRQILDLVNGDINEADKLVQAIAVTSAQTPVAANFDYALQAYYQNKMGQPIKTGKTPVAQSKKLNDIFAGKDWAGRKTNNFYNNLMRVIDPSRTQGVTTDLWMMRAFGYFQSSPTDAQYDFVEGETARLAEELGWEPQQVQAAIWVALKSKAEAKPVKAKAEEISLRKGWMKYKTRKTPEGKTVRERVILDKEKHAKNWLEQALKHSPTLEEKESAKFDYADATTRNLAQISWESIPGSTTGHMAETFEADYPVLQDYHVEISKAFLDNQGNDIVAAELGMLSPMEFEAPGHYEGKVSPGTQTGVTIPKGYKIDQQASPEGKRLMDAYSAAKGILLKQDAMGYHKPFYTKNLTRPKANGILIDIGRPFSEAETIELGRLLRETSGHGDFNPIGDVNGTRLINFSEASNKDFHNIVNTAMRSIEFDDGAEFVGELFVADTGYLENNWEENRNGEGYLEDGLRGQPDLQRKVRDIVTLLQPRVEAVEEEFANKYGWTRNAEINRAYREDIAPELASPPEFPTPRAIPPAEVEAAVEQNLEALENTTGGAVPTFSVKASPEAQAVARNPDLGAKLTEDQNIFYSRTRPSDPETRAAVDKVIQPESRKKGFLESWLPGGKEEGDTYKSQFSKFRQGFINRYEPLEKMDQMMRKTLNTLADSSAYFGMIMSDRSKNMTAGSLKGGIVDYSEGMFKTKDFIYKGKKVDGFLGVLKPLMPSENVFGENLIEVFQALAIAKRAKEINDSGKLSPVAKGEEAAYLAEMEAQAAKYINPETGQSYITEVYEMYQAYNNEVIKLMQKAGLITDEEAQSWSRSAVYYPFYKDFGADPDAETNQETADGKPIKVDSILNIGVESSPSFLPQEKIGSQKLRRLEGSRLKIDVPPLEAMVQNLDAAINMSMKNIAYQRAMRDAVYLGFASKIEKGRKMKALKKGEVSNDIYIREKGRDVHYKVHDPLLFAALTPIADGSLVTAITAVTSIPARFLRESITRSPGFMFVNMERDTLSAFVTSGASFIPVLDTAKNFFADLTEYENLGIITGYDNINDPKDLAAFLKKEMRKKGIDTGASKGTQAWENSLGRVWDLLGKGTQKSDFATRKAVYDDVLARTGSQAEAAFQAIEVLNFGRRGGNTAYRMIAAATPFLNARIQGLDILWRTGLGTYSSRSDLGKAQIQRNALLRAGYLTALTAFYWLLVSDDDQYKEASDYVRDNNWLIPNPFGPEPFKVPTPFEIGLLFKTMPEKVLDATFKEATARDLTQTAARGIGSTLEMNPLGMFQITAPLVEVAVNKNFYTGRQIVPYYIDQGVVKGLQDRVTTTQFAQWLGQSTGMSPLKIDHMLNGYAGSLGMLFIDATDYILRNPAITGDFSASMPTRTLSDHPVTRRFFAREEGTGLAQDFYEMDRYVGQAVQTLNKLEEEGRIEEYQKFLYGREHLVDLQKDFNKISRDLGEFREAKQQIMRMDIHPDSKRDQIKEIDREMNELLSIVPMLKELVRLPVIREGTFKEGGP